MNYFYLSIVVAEKKEYYIDKFASNVTTIFNLIQSMYTIKHFIYHTHSLLSQQKKKKKKERKEKKEKERKKKLNGFILNQLRKYK